MAKVELSGNPRIVYGVGYSGNGVAPSLVGARILAATALNLRDEWASTPLNRGPRSFFPPDPVRYVGGIAVRAAVKRKETAEDDGREAPRLVRAVARLVPSGMQKGGVAPVPSSIESANAGPDG